MSSEARVAGDTRLLPLLGAAGFVSIASTRLCDAMIPALAQAFATGMQEASAVISSYAIAYGLMQLVYGPLGDRYGKPRVIGIASGLCAVTTALAALAPTLQTLVLARIAMGAGTAAIVPLTIAWIGDTVPLAQRQQTLARYSGLTVFGMVAGPLLGGVLTQALGWRAPFMLLAPMFACLSAILLLRPSVGGRARPGAGAQSFSYVRQVSALLRAPWTRWVLLAAIAETGFGIAALAFVPTVLHTRFDLPLAYGGAIAASFGIGGFLFTRSAAPLLRRLHPSMMPAIGGAVMALAFALLAAMPHWSWAALACVLAGFGFFAVHNTLQVQATQLSASATGLAVSLFSCCIFVGQSIGVVVGAVTFTRYAPAWSFAAAAAGTLALGLTLQRGVRSRLTC